MISNKVYNFLRFIPDKLFLSIMFLLRMGKLPNWNNPKTFNEKLQWLKLYNRKPQYSNMVDKYAAKSYVASAIGSKYIIPNLGIWDKPEDIEWDKMPNQFVLKCTHDSGTVLLVKSKSDLDKNSAIKKLNYWLKRDFYILGREWPYKNVKHRIIAEKYMHEDGGLKDYKFYCFNGIAYKVMVCIDRESGCPKFYSFDRDWKLLRHNKLGKAAPKDFTLPKPEKIDEMFDIAEKLSKDIPFLRVDLYYVENEIFFGEMTFYPDSGFDSNILPEIDDLYGSMIRLPVKKSTK